MEDEITSTVFGVMAFMQPTDIYAIWRAILDKSQPTVGMPSDPPATASIRLWPRYFPEAQERRWVEPDAEVQFVWKDGRRMIVIMEAKWNASLQNQQLHEQWRHCLSDEQRPDAFHVFLGKNASDAHAAREDEDIWTVDGKSRLIILTWASIRSALDTLTTANNIPLSNYAQCAAHFLGAIGVHHFHGFKGLMPPEFPEIPPAPTLFWRPFHGFQALQPPVLTPISNPLFFS